MSRRLFRALVQGLRQDPDIIVVGEMRDQGDNFDGDGNVRHRSQGVLDASYGECY